MTPTNDVAIVVTLQWNDWRFGNIRLADLRDVHWHQPKGAPHPLLHAYVACGTLATADLPHPCDETSAPHDVRVCLLKSHNLPGICAMLTRIADQVRNAPRGSGPALPNGSSLPANGR